jgi:hypothetical protein
MWVGTADIPVDVLDDFMNYRYHFRELGDMSSVTSIQPPIILPPIPDSEKRSTLLVQRGLDHNTRVYILYCYFEVSFHTQWALVFLLSNGTQNYSYSGNVANMDANVQSSRPSYASSTIPSNPASQINQHLTQHFTERHRTLTTVLSCDYGAAYKHCVTAQYVTDMCTELGISFAQRSIMPARIEGIATPVFPEDIARCFGVNAATFKTMRTQLAQSREARSILSGMHGSIDPKDLSFLRVLDVLLGDEILDEGLIQATAIGPKREAATMTAAKLSRGVKDVLRRFQSL